MSIGEIVGAVKPMWTAAVKYLPSESPAALSTQYQKVVVYRALVCYTSYVELTAGI